MLNTPINLVVSLRSWLLIVMSSVYSVKRNFSSARKDGFSVYSALEIILIIINNKKMSLRFVWDDDLRGRKLQEIKII